jgi:Flp pilus assembly protein TadD
MTDKTSRLAPGLIAAAITFLVYLPALSGGFVNWDDQRYVYENGLIRSIDLTFIKTIFSTIQVSNFHPLTMLSYAVDFALWGEAPLGYHLVNVILHAINTLFAGLLAARLVEARGIQGGSFAFIASLTTALLFGLHPMHVESVAWVSERKDVLSGLFFILSLLAYLRYHKNRTFKAYATTFAFFILALLSKPMAVTLPAVLLIIDMYPLERPFKEGYGKLIVEKIPFFGASLLLAAVTVVAQEGSGALRSLETDPMGLRVLTAFRGFVFYLVKLIIPTGLAPYYPHPLERAISNYQYWGSIIIFAAITIGAVYAFKKGKGALPAVWAFFVVTLLPVIGIIQVGRQAAADRYIYIPAIGLFVLIGAGLGLLVERKRTALYPVIAGLAAVSIIFSFLTIKQAGIWKDSLTLWSHEIKVYPMTVPTAYNSRGQAWHAAGELEKAVKDYTASITLNPFDAFPYNNRALAFEDMGRTELAIEDYTKAISLDAAFFNAYNNRGIAFGKTGRLSEAVEDFTAALKINPASSSAYLNRGYALMGLERPSEALRDFTRADSLAPGNPVVRYNLGLIYLKLGEAEKAQGFFREAAAGGVEEARQYIK